MRSDGIKALLWIGLLGVTLYIWYETYFKACMDLFDSFWYCI